MLEPTSSTPSRMVRRYSPAAGHGDHAAAAEPIRRTTSCSRSGDVPMFSRTNPRPCSPKPAPEVTATLARARKAAAGSAASAGAAGDAAAAPRRRHRRQHPQPRRPAPCSPAGQKARLRRQVTHRGQVPGQQRRQQRPVLVELAAYRVQPGHAVGEGRLGGQHAQMAGEQGLPSSLQRRGRLVAGHHGNPHFSPGMFQPLEAEVKVKVRWARPPSGSIDRKGMCCAPGSASGAWISSTMRTAPRRAQMSATAPRSSRDHTRPVGLCGCAAGRRPRRRGPGPRPARPGRADSGRRGRGQRRLHHLPARQPEPEKERRVDRRVDDHAGTVRSHLLQHLRDPGHHIRNGVHVPPVGSPAEPLGGKRRVHLAEAERVRIAAVARGDRLPDRVLDRLGQVEVHLGHPGGEHVGRVFGPLPAAAAAQPIQRAVTQQPVHPPTVSPAAAGPVRASPSPLPGRARHTGCHG